ncbi:hypothetical protein A9K55_003566 [Cordyceps militaris]|uniref:Uncharacterized protein n=1 Tax=Cordyceps militaris TaxID=73501 RepID=A0A2H4S8M8_CORMI|nr:hypothetical protein A9K55_003566 [Cordyceps militaris]
MPAIIMPGYPSLVELLGLIVSFREVSAAVSDMGHEAGPGPTCPMPYQGFYPLFKIILVEPQRATVDQSKVRKSVRTAIAGGWTALSAVEDTILRWLIHGCGGSHTVWPPWPGGFKCRDQANNKLRYDNPGI